MTTLSARHESTVGPIDVTHTEIRAQLERILRSREFQNSKRLQRFLQFAVQCVLGGTPDDLKESTLGREVYDRGSAYDPSIDSIVRVEAHRLRRKLREYYEGEKGRADTVSITFQPGSYTPVIARLVAKHEREPHQPESPVLPGPSPQTVAVLPFCNASADPQQEYFCDGITDDIISALSRIPGLNVIGRTSAFAMKGTSQDIRQIGTRLGAGTIVDGSVRKSAKQVKIFAEIVDTATGEVRWAENFDRVVEEVFQMEMEVAQAVARVLHATLAPPVSRRLIRSTLNMDAYLLHLRGRYELNRMSSDGHRAAAKIFENAISLFPHYAPPYAGLADVYANLALWGAARPRDVFPKAQQAAQFALKLDPFLPHAYSLTAIATGFYEWKWEEALGIASRALKLDPSSALGHQAYAWCLIACGKLDEGREHLERGVALDPLSVRAHGMLGFTLYLLRQPVAAEKWLQAALLLDREPAQVQTHYLLARVYLSQFRYDDALQHARKCQTETPDPLCLGVLGASLALLGDREEAMQIVGRLSRMQESAYIDPLALGLVQIGLKQTEAAIESLRKSLDERTPFAALANLDPAFDSLRTDSRFQQITSQLSGHSSAPELIPNSGEIPELWFPPRAAIPEIICS